MSATQPASGAHTQRHSLSPCPPPALRHPYVAILPSRRVPGRRSHAVLLCVPAPRIASVRRNPPFPRPVLANHFASAGVSNWGDRREIDIYISPNSFPGPVGRQKIPWVATVLCKGHRGFVSFSVRIVNTIEDPSPRMPKVTCFTVKFDLSIGAAPERQQCRGW